MHEIVIDKNEQTLTMGKLQNKKRWNGGGMNVASPRLILLILIFVETIFICILGDIFAWDANQKTKKQTFTEENILVF